MYVTTLALTPRTPQWLAHLVEYVSRGLRNSRHDRGDWAAVGAALELRRHQAWEVSVHPGWLEFSRDLLNVDGTWLDGLIAQYEERQSRERSEDAQDVARFGHTHRSPFGRCEVCGGCRACRWAHPECQEQDRAVRAARAKQKLVETLARDGYLGPASHYPWAGWLGIAAHTELVASKAIRRKLMVEPDPYLRGLVERGVVRGTKSGKIVRYVLSPGVRLQDLVDAADAELGYARDQLILAIQRAHAIELDQRLVALYVARIPGATSAPSERVTEKIA